MQAKFNMTPQDVLDTICAHCDLETNIDIEFSTGAILVPFTEDIAFGMTFDKDGTSYIICENRDSGFTKLLDSDYIRKNWMMKIGKEFIEMRYHAGTNFDFDAAIYTLYDRITWESLKGVDENA